MKISFATLASLALILAPLSGLAQAAPQTVQQPATQAGPSPAQIAAEQKWLAHEARIQAAKQQALRNQIEQVNRDGLPVRIGTIAHFRGARDFQLSGIGLVVGLQNTGDTQKSALTQTLYANYFKSHNLTVDPSTVKALNVALVEVTATMPAFSKPGTLMDVTVSSIADAKSLQGGTLIMTPLYDAASNSTVIASAQGPLSLGGFSAGANGSSVQSNAVNVGRIPGGGEVQTRINSQVVFEDNNHQVLYLDLDDPDADTVSRVVRAIQNFNMQMHPYAVDNTTVAITVPPGMDPETAMGKIAQVEVNVLIPARVVINERTGTVVVGGDVRLGPAMIVSGSLNVQIDTSNQVVQPNPFSQGQTASQSNSQVSAGQDTAKVAVIPTQSTVADLARIFQALQLKPNDVIQILQLLQQQGALKARIVLQ